MSKSKVTLSGFYEYLETTGEGLFEEIELTSLINKETLINNILFECGEFEVLYADLNFYKKAVNHFFKLNYDLFNRWATDLQREYNPLENYDRFENWTDSSENLTSESETTSSSMLNSETASNNSTSINEKSAYDSNTLVADDKNIFAGNSGNNSSSNASGTRGNTASNSGESEHDGRIHGNIGVTTSQQMLESEMVLRQKWQLIKIITDMFMNDLTIPVYE